MKKILITLVLCAGASLCAAGWGRQGHSTVAYIAETHLTPRAKKQIAEYLHGNTLTSVASLNDAFKGVMKVDMGSEFLSGEPRINTLPHTFEADMNFEPNRKINDDGRYVKNCVWFIEQYAASLKAGAREMDDSTRFARIASIVHFVGDMHCPEHIRYHSANPDEGDMTIGYYNVKFKGEEIRFHSLWDTEVIIANRPWGFTDLAYLIDTASKKEIREITSGDVWDWARDSAECSYEVHSVKPGQKLGKYYIYEHQALVDSQLRKAGYRLAKILNDIFD